MHVENACGSAVRILVCTSFHKLAQSRLKYMFYPHHSRTCISTVRTLSNPGSEAATALNTFNLSMRVFGP